MTTPYRIKICPVCLKQDVERIGICQHFDPVERYIDTVEVYVEPAGSLEGLPVNQRVYEETT